MSSISAFQQTRKGSPTVGQVAVIDQPQSISIAEMEYPAPGPGEVRVRLEGCGVCGSNLPVWEGRPWFKYPREAGAPGHEGWGTVDAVGKDVERFSVGDRVTLLSYHAFATHDTAPAELVLPLPDSWDEIPFPGEALGCAMNVFDRCQIQAGQYVAVVGVGFLGALLIQLAKSAGAEVIGISRREFSREVARKCGADQVLSTTEGNIEQQIGRFTISAGCDCVIEATGLAEPLELAARLVTTRGRLVIAGFHQDGPRTIDMQSWNWRGIDVINAHERDPEMYVAGMKQAIDAVENGRLKIEELITHRFPLEKLNDALRLATERPQGFVKAWVDCSQQEKR